MYDAVKINRGIKKRNPYFFEVFENFEDVPAIKKIFGKRTKHALSELRVHIPRSAKWNYMWIDDKKGRLVIAPQYLKKGDRKHLYLDVVHELVHIRQYLEGKELFDKSYEYIDRPTEIEAYKISVAEARRIGLSKKWIVNYLRVPGWIDGITLKRLRRNIGLD